MIGVASVGAVLVTMPIIFRIDYVVDRYTCQGNRRKVPTSIGFMVERRATRESCSTVRLLNQPIDVPAVGDMLETERSQMAN